MSAEYLIVRAVMDPSPTVLAGAGGGTLDAALSPFHLI